MDLKSVFYTVLLLTLCSLLKLNNADDLVVKTNKGYVRGFIQKDYHNGTIYCFTSIPYAKPPIKELRFMDPQPADSWQGILNTTKKEPRCVQESGGSENCLFLNVYTPKLPTGTKCSKLLPIMYYIFGGAFLTGYTPDNPGFLLAKEVILVEVNYRINVFGFLSFEDPKLGVPGNAGLKDQAMGLRWVQENIKQFCGDPNNVTIFGASAGSSSVNLQVISQFSKGLYHRAISESAVSTAPWVLTPRLYKELSSVLGFKSNDPAQILALLRNASTTDIVIAETRVFVNYTKIHLGSLNAFGPVIETPNDNAFLTEHPEAILFRGDFNKVDYLMGFCTDEGYAWDQIPTFLRPNFTKSEDLVPKDLGVQKGSNISTIIGDQIQYFYYKNATPSYENYNIYAKYVADLLFTYKVYNVSKLMAKHVNVYFYLFAYSTPMDPSATGLSQHVNEFYYIFRDLKEIPIIKPGSVEDIAVYRTTTLWTNFAKTGNPNSKVADPLLNITWPPLREHKFRYLHIKPKLEVGMGVPFRSRMTFWDNLYREASNVETDRIPDSLSQQSFITNLHQSLTSQKFQTD